MKIVGVQSDVYSDGGWNLNNADSSFALRFGQSCYHIPALSYTPYGVTTQTQEEFVHNTSTHLAKLFFKYPSHLYLL